MLRFEDPDTRALIHLNCLLLIATTGQKPIRLFTSRFNHAHVIVLLCAAVETVTLSEFVCANNVFADIWLRWLI